MRRHKYRNKMGRDFVKIRERLRESGLTSLILEYSYRGKRKEESLHLYIVPERTPADRKKNKETRMTAEKVRAQRLTEMTEGIFKFKSGSDVGLLEFFNKLVEEKKEGSSKKQWLSTYKKLEEFCHRKDIPICDVDSSFVEKFIKYLNRDAKCVVNRIGHNLRTNTQWLYYTKLHAALNNAVRQHIIDRDPCIGINTPKKEQTHREFLSVDELSRLINTECPNSTTRTYFIFSCLTGLRCSDIIKLKWENVSENEGFTRITFRQQKTSELQYLDLNEQAVALMGERKANSDFIFPRLQTEQSINKHIREWARNAGISKHLSFHCARHTFATMLLNLDTDLFTVSKLLGHSSIRTTQIYAKVLDKSRQEAVQKIPKLNI